MLNDPPELLDFAPSMSAFEADVIRGLTRQRKFLPAKYFYDEVGAGLFEEICKLPEYYLARVETDILRSHAAEIASLVGPEVRLVEFGSGTCEKVRLLLTALAGC